MRGLQADLRSGRGLPGVVSMTGGQGRILLTYDLSSVLVLTLIVGHAVWISGPSGWLLVILVASKLSALRWMIARNLGRCT